MTSYTTAQLAEIRRRQLIAEVTCQRQARACRTRPATGWRRRLRRRLTRLRRPLTGFRTWMAVGQL